MNRRLPVTLVGGFPGAGKTSLLHHFITEHQGGFLAVFLQSGDQPNLDAQAIKGLGGAMGRRHDRVLEFPSGDEAVQLDWLRGRLQDLANERRFERVLIEVVGTANASWLGAELSLASSQQSPHPLAIEVQQNICVIDALDFHREVVLPRLEGRSSPLLDFQCAQIQEASLLVLNKCDLVKETEIRACVEQLHALNPDAPFVETAYGEVPAEIWSRTQTLAELQHALQKRKLKMTAMESENKPVALSHFVYRAYRPFHPERFWQWFQQNQPGLLRAKGLIWLATRNLLAGGISRTRWQNGCGVAGIWWAALPREEWPSDSEALARMQETWREPYGDRRQELVLLGDSDSLPEVARKLDSCLLQAAAEYAQPVTEWQTFPDPFPTWDVADSG